MLSDIEIAQSTKLTRIDDLAHAWGLEDDEFEPYGCDKAKVTLHKDRKAAGKLILVTATSGMPAGSGKTTTSIALAQGMNRLGKKSRFGTARALARARIRHERRRGRRRLLTSPSDGID